MAHSLAKRFRSTPARLRCAILRCFFSREFVHTWTSFPRLCKRVSMLLEEFRQRMGVQTLVNGLPNGQPRGACISLLSNGRTSCIRVSIRRHTPRKIFPKGSFLTMMTNTCPAILESSQSKKREENDPMDDRAPEPVNIRGYRQIL